MICANSGARSWLAGEASLWSGRLSIGFGNDACSNFSSLARVLGATLAKAVFTECGLTLWCVEVASQQVAANGIKSAKMERVVFINQPEGKDMSIITIGIDLAKTVFAVHGD